MAPKRKPFIAVELSVFEEVEAMAASSGRTEAEIGWGLAKIWRRCWKLGAVVLPESVVRGFMPAGVEILIDFGFAERVENGVRIRGLDRYLKTVTAQREAAKKTNEKRWAKNDVIGSLSDNEGAEGSESESVSDHQSRGKPDGDRREDPKIRRVDGSDSVKKKKPKQDTLEGIPEKPKPLASRLWEYFTEVRELTICGDTATGGMGMAGPPDDEPVNFPRWAAAIAEFRKATAPDADEAEAEVHLRNLIDRFCESPFWRNAVRKGSVDEPQPLPWKALVAPESSKRLIAEYLEFLDGGAK